jgi:hypothetical protein
MAFVALSLSTQEILETTYVSDMRIISNSNTGLLKSKLEDLINNLKIDLSDKNDLSQNKRTFVIKLLLFTSNKDGCKTIFA